MEKKIRRHLKLTNDLWRVDETYNKVKGEWKYLYRAVDSAGNTIDFMLSAKRDRKAAKRFFKFVVDTNMIARHNICILTIRG
jgi:transposase-like protein